MRQTLSGLSRQTVAGLENGSLNDLGVKLAEALSVYRRALWA